MFYFTHLAIYRIPSKTLQQMKRLILTAVLTCTLCNAWAKEYHVSADAKAEGNGSFQSPFKTINSAAQVARAGDTITVYEGTYREWVDPKHGGTDPGNPILYRAANGATVQLKGSEVVKGWEKQKNGTWTITLPESFFGGYNALNTDVEGDWFWPYSKRNHTADIYVNGISMYETDSLHKVTKVPRTDVNERSYTWYTETNAGETTVWANFQDYNPNKELIEVSLRPTCFYPTQRGVNYITLRGFDISQAASQWGAPTAHQVGMVATHWNKGWIIEENTIHDTKSSGITLGKDESTGHNVWSAHQAKDGSLHYIETVFKVLALPDPWSKEYTGSHIVRNNTIYNCEQTGICGSMGCAFSEIYGNHIYNIWKKRQFDGAEIAGIKFHGAIDTHIRDNNIHDCKWGVWLDWMTQGTRVSGNLFFNNASDDLFVEVNHGPYVIDNNICLSPKSIRNQSQGAAFVNNLFCGDNYVFSEHSRYTPYHLPHSTAIKGLSVIGAGDDRYYNNVFIPTEGNVNHHGLEVYNQSKFQFTPPAANNVYCNTAKGAKDESVASVTNLQVAKPTIVENEKGEFVLSLPMINYPTDVPVIVTSALLGKTEVSEDIYTNPDGTAFVIDRDYFGKERSARLNGYGPFAVNAKTNNLVVVWPK